MGVFPNPTDGHFTVLVPDNTPYDLVVYNALGQSVFEEDNVNSSEKAFELLHLESGTYVVRLFIGDRTVSKKIIVSK